MTIPNLCKTEGCENFVESKYNWLCDYCKAKEAAASGVPDYYGGGKGWDSYKYATFHKFPPALAHAHKYITRAGKKEGESYEKAIENAIHALERDLEIRREINGRFT